MICGQYLPKSTGAEQDLREISITRALCATTTAVSIPAPVLLFLHGSGPGVTGWRNFRGVLPTFAEHFRCLILEFPGFGVTDDFGGHPMVTAFGAVPPFLDALGVEKASTSSATRWAAVSASTSPSRIPTASAGW